MLDLRSIQENPAMLEDILARRRFKGVNVPELMAKLEESRSLKSKIDGLRGERNSASKEIGQLIGQGKKDEAEKRKSEVKGLGDEIHGLEEKYHGIQEAMELDLLLLPNVIDPDVPDGEDETANKEIRVEGKKPEFSFEPKKHYDMGEAMGIFDFERGVKLAGSRFYTYRGLGARLERALISFMLDLHTEENGYTEMWVPSLINEEGMMKSGQYPKFKGDFYDLEKDGLALIPTSEVSLVNLHTDEIIDEKDLPIALTTATSCFRREAGAAGKDNRGLVRVHQFQKVELVQVVHPDKSHEAHEQMLAHAEKVLQRLGLHYRVLLLCSGDMGATAAKTYDLEVWMPGLDRWLEISSVSNCLDYQARRGLIRYRPEGPKKKPVLAHTLNGSGLAAGRTLIAVMENYQKEDGTFEIPEALKPYMRM